MRVEHGLTLYIQGDGAPQRSNFVNDFSIDVHVHHAAFELHGVLNAMNAAQVARVGRFNMDMLRNGGMPSAGF